MMKTMLRVDNLNKKFGGLIATNNVSLTVDHQEIHAFIGPNGAGKSTLIAQLMGELTPDSGTITLGDKDISQTKSNERVKLGLARTFQVTCLLPDFTSLDNVALAILVHRGHSFHFWRNMHFDQQLRQEALTYLSKIHLQKKADILVANLSHGEQKQLELAIALASKPSVLLLDEPMAGLGAAESQEMVKLLLEIKKHVGILLIEHDMDAVFQLADRISVLVYGQIIATGSIDDIRNNPLVKTAYLGEGDEPC
ncbi:ABC transporter ATP-binding protein [Bartonella sp. HY329]|uniref:ABC transporter ATP-binding protein n=1 Tax=unclassified Bartonella TaxID=2645622 RepID=UPI0021C89601|nr:MULTISPECIES: ABC transporter ATP-binding protein [unclassified Bartonella]UXM96434.1 ABC transporter ATP-binding protein [Bartonella sp. HY329]UXN10757.1 ABC transporter ATP-binding protein [Bartonella sp. HY328]